tara:strand:- start:66 stop:236 length:171 start_codon:yes stop_codon:yes gene_type:complete
MQVQQNIDLNFADGVRALLRQDPDIIMAGEFRNIETADGDLGGARWSLGHLNTSYQ